MCLASRIHLLSYSSITSCWGQVPVRQSDDIRQEDRGSVRALL